jgi:hypothetical protein
MRTIMKLNVINNHFPRPIILTYFEPKLFLANTLLVTSSVLLLDIPKIDFPSDETLASSNSFLSISASFLGCIFLEFLFTSFIYIKM